MSLNIQNSSICFILIFKNLLKNTNFYFKKKVCNKGHPNLAHILENLIFVYLHPNLMIFLSMVIYFTWWPRIH